MDTEDTEDKGQRIQRTGHRERQRHREQRTERQRHRGDRETQDRETQMRIWTAMEVGRCLPTVR